MNTRINSLFNFILNKHRTRKETVIKRIAMNLNEPMKPLA